MLVARLVLKVYQEIIKEQMISAKITGLVRTYRYSVSLWTIRYETWQRSCY